MKKKETTLEKARSSLKKAERATTPKSIKKKLETKGKKS